MEGWFSLQALAQVWEELVHWPFIKLDVGSFFVLET
jgi:hypothetical protein